jgi:hypothetical protein
MTHERKLGFSELDERRRKKTRLAVAEHSDEWMVRYVHKISPSNQDVKGPITIPGGAFSNSKMLGAALRRAGVLAPGAQVRSFRVEGDKVVVFPSLPGSTTYWHSIILTNADSNPNAREAREPHLARDYIAVDTRGRTIAGPFKSHSDAKHAAGVGGHVEYVRETGTAGVFEVDEGPGIEARRKPSVKLTPTEKFFYDHAGFGYSSGADKKQQEAAHVQNAKSLARAEAESEKRGWTVEWEHDQDADTSWMDPEQLDDYQSGRTEILSAQLLDENGEVLESLGGIALNARSSTRDPYGRVVEAEMAQEALGRKSVREARPRPKAKRSAARRR